MSRSQSPERERTEISILYENDHSVSKQQSQAFPVHITRLQQCCVNPSAVGVYFHISRQADSVRDMIMDGEAIQVFQDIKK